MNIGLGCPARARPFHQPGTGPFKGQEAEEKVKEEKRFIHLKFLQAPLSQPSRKGSDPVEEQSLAGVGGEETAIAIGSGGEGEGGGLNNLA